MSSCSSLHGSAAISVSGNPCAIAAGIAGCVISRDGTNQVGGILYNLPGSQTHSSRMVSLDVMLASANNGSITSISIYFGRTRVYHADNLNHRASFSVPFSTITTRIASTEVGMVVAFGLAFPANNSTITMESVAIVYH